MTDQNFYTFPPSSKEDWIAQVKKDLKGKDFTDSLTSTLWEKIKIEPFYTSEDLSEKVIGYTFHPDAKLPGFSPRMWDNIVSIYSENENSANKEILHTLKNGAEGLILYLEGTENLNQLLKGVHTEFISTNFLPTGETVLFFRAIQEWHAQRSSTLEPLR